MNEGSFKRSFTKRIGLGFLLFAQLSYAEALPAAPTSDRVTSQVMFERGRSLFVQGQYAEACPLLEESHRLSPGIGVLLHLGACLENSGKIANAWAAFHEAADRARAEGDKKREGIARTRADELRRNLSYLTLRVRSASGEVVTTTGSVPEGLDVRRDGQTIPIVALGLEVPVDPGAHHVVVRATNMHEVTKSVSLAVGEHASLELELVSSPEAEVPTAKPATLPAEPLRPTLAPTASTVRLMPAPRRRQSTDAWSYAAWTAAGIGGVGLVTGGVAGLVAYTKMSQAKAACEGHANNDCPENALQHQQDARLPATISTVALTVGATGLAFAGGYWLLSQRRQTVMTGSIQPGVALIAVHSRW